MDGNKQLDIAPRVSLGLIKRLYQTYSQGIVDEELIDDVAYRLQQRCEDFLLACKAVAGIATCPACRSEIPHDGTRDCNLECSCGWQSSWGDYFDAIRHRQLSGAEPVQRLFKEYVSQLRKARSPAEKMLEIDKLIHGFHWYLKHPDQPTRPVAVNLLAGRLTEVINCLNELTYSSSSGPDLIEVNERWLKNLEKAGKILNMDLPCEP